MKKLLTVAALLTATFVSTARESKIFNKEHMNVSVHGRYTHMLDGHGLYNNMLETYGTGLVGVQVGFDTHSSDSSWWAQAYNFPHLALGFSYDGTNSLKTKSGAAMGDFYNLYAAMEFDFFRAGIFSLGPVIEVGASYCTSRYDPVTNSSNKFIGSSLVANLAGGLEARFRIFPQWEIALTGYLIHHSNGMTRVPNWGTNQAAAGAKLKYYMAPQQKEKKLPLDKPAYPKGLCWNVYTAAGVHSCSVEQNALQSAGETGYPVTPRIRALVGAEGAWRYHPLLSTGIGIEANYAGNRYRENDLVLKGVEDPAGYSPFYTSVHVVQNLHYSDFSLHFAWGVYTFKRVGLSEDMGRCFQRIGARYHLPAFKVGQMFLGFDMRAHFLDRSYCLEYSVGVTF